MKCVDIGRARELRYKGRHTEIPHGSKSYMEPAHIVPLKLYLNTSDGAIRDPLAMIVCGVFSFIHLIHIRRQTEPSRSREMLQAWTRLDLDAVESINSPSNSIYMSIVRYLAFTNVRFYLDKEAVSFLC